MSLEVEYFRLSLPDEIQTYEQMLKRQLLSFGVRPIAAWVLSSHPHLAADYIGLRLNPITLDLNPEQLDNVRNAPLHPDTQDLFDVVDEIEYIRGYAKPRKEIYTGRTEVLERIISIQELWEDRVFNKEADYMIMKALSIYDFTESDFMYVKELYEKNRMIADIEQSIGQAEQIEDENTAYSLNLEVAQLYTDIEILLTKYRRGDK